MSRWAWTLAALLVLLPAVADAQNRPAPYPPNASRPYRGGTNCVQVANSDGFFDCSPLVTINPLTGAFNSVLGGPISSAVALVVGPSGNTLGALGNDFVLSKQTYVQTAPVGPGAGVTFRVRPSSRVPGYCTVVAIAGNAFGPALEFPVAFLNPAYPFTGDPRQAALTGLADFFITDLPGGPGGC